MTVSLLSCKLFNICSVYETKNYNFWAILSCWRWFLKKVKSKEPYFTSITFDRNWTDNLKVDGSLILPLSFHQRSILRVFKGSWSYTERRSVETRIWCHRGSSLGSHAPSREPRTKHLYHPCMLWSHRSVDFICAALTSSNNIIDRQRIVFCPHSTQVSDTNHHGFQANFLKWNITSFDEVDFAPHVQELKISEELEKSIT